MCSRRRPDGNQVGEPAEAVPSGEPARSGFGRLPCRHRIAHQLAAKFDIAGQDGCAAIGIARPALVELDAQIRRHGTEQGVPVKRSGGQGAPSIPPQPCEQVGVLRAVPAGGARRGPARLRSRLHQRRARIAVPAEPATRRRAGTDCPAVAHMRLGNKETIDPQPGAPRPARTARALRSQPAVEAPARYLHFWAANQAFASFTRRAA